MTALAFAGRGGSRPSTGWPPTPCRRCRWCTWRRAGACRPPGGASRRGRWCAGTTSCPAGRTPWWWPPRRRCTGGRRSGPSRPGPPPWWRPPGRHAGRRRRPGGPGRARPGGVRREPGPLAGGGRGGGACRRIGALTFLEVRLAQGLPDWAEERTEPSWGGGVLFDLGVHAGARAADGRPGPGDGRGGGDDPHRRAPHGRRRRRGGAGVRHRPAGRGHGIVAGPGSGLGRPGRQRHRSGAAGARARAVGRGQRRGPAHPAAPPEVAAPQLHHLGYVAQLEALAADLEAGAAPRSTAVLGRLVLEVVCAAYRATHGRAHPAPLRRSRDRTPYEIWQED